MVAAMRASLAAALLVVISATGCDSRATASETTSRGEQKSKEFESCAASAECVDELRCFDHTCRRTARSTVGDYFAALGQVARGKGEVEASIAAYAQAVSRYDADKVALPPDLDCAYGAALAAGRGKKDHAELAARVLHRCVLAVPVGSPLRGQALADLALLADAGLDPALLAGNKVADLYLTKAPTRPSADKLTVAVTPSPPLPAKAAAALTEKFNDPDVHAGLAACWTAYNAASQKEALTATIGVKATYIASDYEDEPGAFAVKLEPAAGLAAGSAEATADACVRQLVEPALKALKLSEAFATKLAITIR
jgi:hypothetical protein